jgi:hypothetical protein
MFIKGKDPSGVALAEPVQRPARRVISATPGTEPLLPPELDEAEVAAPEEPVAVEPLAPEVEPPPEVDAAPKVAAELEAEGLDEQPTAATSVAMITKRI